MTDPIKGNIGGYLGRTNPDHHLNETTKKTVKDKKTSLFEFKKMPPVKMPIGEDKSNDTAFDITYQEDKTNDRIFAVPDYSSIKDLDLSKINGKKLMKDFEDKYKKL